MFAYTLPLQFSPRPLVLRPLLGFRWVAGLLFCNSVRCFRCFLGVPVPSGMSPCCRLSAPCWFYACNIVLCSQLVPVLMSFHGSFACGAASSVVLYRPLCTPVAFAWLSGCCVPLCMLHSFALGPFVPLPFLVGVPFSGSFSVGSFRVPCHCCVGPWLALVVGFTPTFAT